MKCKFIIMGILVLSLSITAKEVVRTQWVDFGKIATKTTIVGRLEGHEKMAYKVEATKNQFMQIKIASNEIYFDVFEPNRDTNDGALFMGKIDGHTYSAKLKKSGEYTIKVYLRNTKEHEYTKVIYSMDIELK